MSEKDISAIFFNGLKLRAIFTAKSNSGHSMIFASVPETGEGTGESNIKY